MKKKTKLLIGVPLLAAAAALAVNIGLVDRRGSPVSIGEYNEAISKANYCAADADCGVSKARCQLVEQLVNVREITHIADLQRRYFAWGGECMVLEYAGIYDFSRRYCSNSKCVAPRIGKAGVEREPASTKPAERLQDYGK